ncbi:response regulator transcription factor [Ramlibacter sp.]|uniref:response regulator transcription factor n=1 Tax=Ramlibacter sp. TaxID=1917967 RepID=UPI002CA274FF|nr:response regulator transcription factor [Ramlibacter sp.]HWI81796.1 response regulator transcription factor [Ramlibacter sp.]
MATCTDPIRVFIIGVPLLRWGLERMVQTAHPRCEVAGGADSLDEARTMESRRAAHVVVLAVDVAPEQIATFCAASPVKLILVTGSRDEGMLDRAIVAGLRGVVRIGDSPETFLKAIAKVNEGELWIDRGATGRIFLALAREKAAERRDPERAKIATLTLRERHTIAAVASDAAAPGKVIADRLCISEHTLRNHLTSIYSKLSLANRVDLYAYANRHSLQQVPDQRGRAGSF